MAGLALPLSSARAAARLNVSFDGDNLHVTAPQLHFLTGKPLSRLHDGATVVFLSQITLFQQDHATVFRRASDRLTVSEDVWDEGKFSVMLATGGRSVKGLSVAAAETWCLDNLAISALGIAPDWPFWFRFELRVADPRELSAVVGDSGISLTGMIEALSRKPRGDDDPWTLEAGPLRLAQLPRLTGRGARNE
ncbi:MAG: hypothetical protein LAP40_23670 [Acidobacteriia bacterium]|nr:hypothetical protein [Terriglobia bacterium]